MTKTDCLGGVILGLTSSAAVAASTGETPATIAKPAIQPRIVEVASVPPPPPHIIYDSDQRRELASEDAVEPVTFDVVVSKGRERLLADSLTVGGKSSASISRSKSEYAGPCPGDDETKRSSRSLRESMNLSIYPIRWRKGEEEMFNVSLAIQVPQSTCGANGINSLGITRKMELAPGKSQVLEGPDGLTMRISRRK